MNIFTFENHFDEKDTIIVGDYVINGCQNFHISKLDEVCEEFNVPNEMKKQVIEQHSKMTCENLEEHAKHQNIDVRKSVARQGYALDILINDEDYCVRYAVAEQGYGLDVLINDYHYVVRKFIAEQGYGLDKLINDEDWYVRYAVAEQGYGLDKLINDEHYLVRNITKRMMIEKAN